MFSNRRIQPHSSEPKQTIPRPKTPHCLSWIGVLVGAIVVEVGEDKGIGTFTGVVTGTGKFVVQGAAIGDGTGTGTESTNGTGAAMGMFTGSRCGTETGTGTGAAGL